MRFRVILDKLGHFLTKILVGPLGGTCFSQYSIYMVGQFDRFGLTALLNVHRQWHEPLAEGVERKTLIRAIAKFLQNLDAEIRHETDSQLQDTIRRSATQIQ